MLPINTCLLSYEDPLGRRPFESWFNKLNPVAAAKVAVALTRLERGNVAHVKRVSGGVQELKIDHGPGYRVYFGREGRKVVILLAGATKKRQQADIRAARNRRKDHRERSRRDE